MTYFEERALPTDNIIFLLFPDLSVKGHCLSVSCYKLPSDEQADGVNRDVGLGESAQSKKFRTQRWGTNGHTYFYFSSVSYV